MKTAAQRSLEAEVIQAINTHFMGADAQPLAAHTPTAFALLANLEQDAEFKITIERIK